MDHVHPVESSLHSGDEVLEEVDGDSVDMGKVLAAGDRKEEVNFPL